MTNSQQGLDASIWAKTKSRPSNHKPLLLPPSPASYSPHRPSPPRSSSHSPSRQPPDHPQQPPTQANYQPTSTGVIRLTPTQAFHRFDQACQRLRWKFIDLESSYHRAAHPENFAFSRADAERNFKVDFHEFYVWIEQAVVLLLLIFGITVTRDSPSGIESSMYSRTKGFNAGHAYHHNVLKTLEDKKCPVHEYLGKGDVIEAFWKAKELRNRWKDAAQGKETPSLQMYDLRWIVGQVLSGLEVAYHAADRKVKEEINQSIEQGGKADEKMMELETEDDQWEWMVEPMDWEAA